MPIVPTPAAARYSSAGEPRPPAPMHEHLGLEDLDLPGLADLGKEEVTRVAVALVVVEEARDRVVVAEVLPAGEAAGHRDDVRVAELLERASGEDAPHAGGAVDDDLGVLVGKDVLGPALEMGPGEVVGDRDLAEGDLLLLPHVEELEGSPWSRRSFTSSGVTSPISARSCRYRSRKFAMFLPYNSCKVP